MGNSPFPVPLVKRYTVVPQVVRQRILILVCTVRVGRAAFFRLDEVDHVSVAMNTVNSASRAQTSIQLAKSLIYFLVAVTNCDQ